MAETAEKLRRIGLDSDSSLFEEEANSPGSFVRSLLEERNKNDILGLSTLELLQNNVTGSYERPSLCDYFDSIFFIKFFAN